MHGPALAPCARVQRNGPRGTTHGGRETHAGVSDTFPSAAPRRPLERAAAPRHVPTAPDALPPERAAAPRRASGARVSIDAPSRAARPTPPPPRPCLDCLHPCPRAQPVGGHHARSIESTPDGRRPVAITWKSAARLRCLRQGAGRDSSLHHPTLLCRRSVRRPHKIPSPPGPKTF